MTSTRPRQPAGTVRTSEKVGGRFAPNTVPAINETDIGFNDDLSATMVGPPCDWDKRTARVGHLHAVFERTVETGDDGNKVVTITTNCDPPEVMLLARKGDAGYWSDDIWYLNREDRRMWCADITLTMLQQGLISTSPSPGTDDGVRAAMKAASNQHQPIGLGAPWGHSLTEVVAQIRGLRLLQSMAPAKGWYTTLGDYVIPDRVHELLNQCFDDTHRAYMRLLRPPWEDSVPWGAQPVAGHATTDHNETMFVGENGDLLWRALTEPELSGLSPLKVGIVEKIGGLWVREMVVAAALYDDTAAEQLTTGLFDGVNPQHRRSLRTNTLAAFTIELNPKGEPCRWSEQQQNRIRGFVDVIDGLDL